MGEGQTPFNRLNPAEENTYVKVDYMMPTLSYKDWRAAVLLPIAIQLGAAKVIADSSGNAKTAIAAYAIRCTIDCDKYLSKETSPKKVAQIKAHNATIKEIASNLEDVANAAQQAVEIENVFYASHVYSLSIQAFHVEWTTVVTDAGYLKYIKVEGENGGFSMRSGIEIRLIYDK